MYSVTFNLTGGWSALNGTWDVTRSGDTCWWIGTANGLYEFGISCLGNEWWVQYPPGGDVGGLGGRLSNQDGCPTLGVYDIYTLDSGHQQIGACLGTATVNSNPLP